MSEHYDFHYQPTGSGAISGQQVLQQTEDAINELGDYVNDNVGGAMDVAQQALETAQNAEQDAQTALDTANSFSSAIQSAQQDANTALSTAQTAQTTASNANNTAIQASQDASSAVTTANNASGQVSTLSGTVTALGQRVTTAEGNIGQNTSDITALTTRVGTAEGNITTLQNDVSVAMGNASSAMATAGQVKQQAFVFRYSSTALVASSTNSNALLDNTDNLKVGDKVIDSSGVLFSITAIDTVNSTFTVGSALVDLALDANVVHTSGDETITGTKTLDNVDLPFKNSAELGVSGGSTNITFSDKNGQQLCGLKANVFSSGTPVFQINLTQKVDNTLYTTNGIAVYQSANSKVIQVRPTLANDNADGLKVELGSTANRFNRIYGLAYYYGNNNIEFSTKFVTTDTNQTISGAKTFSDLQIIEYGTQYKGARNAYILPEFSAGYSGLSITTLGFPQTLKIGNFVLDANNKPSLDTSKGYIQFATGESNGVNTCVLEPRNSTSSSLGTSANKWKSFNDLEPSFLSLPSGNSSDRLDISSYITAFDGTTNSYTPLANGWISISVNNCTEVYVFLNNLYGVDNNRPTAGSIRVTLPVLKGIPVGIRITGDSLVFARFLPCQGNV